MILFIIIVLRCEIPTGYLPTSLEINALIRCRVYNIASNIFQIGTTILTNRYSKASMDGYGYLYSESYKPIQRVKGTDFPCLNHLSDVRYNRDA